jgi:hypothetical protein
MEERIEWSTYETFRIPRSTDWYWTVATITIICAIAAGIANNLLFAILIILAGFLIILFAKKPARQITCVLTKYGVLVNKDLYPYATIKSFWVSEEPHANILILALDASIFSHLHLPLGAELFPDTVRAHLVQFVPEVPHQKKFSDAVGEYFGL